MSDYSAPNYFQKQIDELAEELSTLRTRLEAAETQAAKYREVLESWATCAGYPRDCTPGCGGISCFHADAQDALAPSDLRVLVDRAVLEELKEIAKRAGYQLDAVEVCRTQNCTACPRLECCDNLSMFSPGEVAKRVRALQDVVRREGLEERE